MVKKKEDNEDLDTGFNPKYKKLIQHLTEGLEAMSNEELKEAIVKSQKSICDVEKDIEADEHLKALKDEIKEITGGFRDLTRVEQAKTAYCVFLLRSRGEE